MASTATKEYSPVALSGFSAADAYDAHRPSYIPESVSHLLTELSVAGVPGAKIVDLAAGTGKFTELIAAREEGYEIVAVEPHDEMLGTLNAKELKGVESKKGDAYSIPVADGWADTVIVAQAFHWFANTASLTEISRVLKPNGKLGFIWNVEDYNQSKTYKTTTKWEEAFKALNWENTKDTSPRYKDSKWRAAFEDQKLFAVPLGERIFNVEIWLGDAALWKRLGTLSNIANLTEEERKELKIGFDKILSTGEDITRNEKGEVAIHYIVHTAWTTKI
ncbi:hypothetical protein RUND412_006250 [Rhizina undulata]